MKTAVLAITQGATKLGQQVAAGLNADFVPCREKFATVFAHTWQTYQAIVCVMATGIVVRTMAPLLEDKRKDPAVVVCDEQGKFAISLLSGHIGGANALAHSVAGLTGGQAVITTASDVLGHTALDLWCIQLGLQAQNKEMLTKKMGRLVNTGSLNIYSEPPLPPLPALPVDLKSVPSAEEADLIVTYRNIKSKTAAVLSPKALALGIGCRKGTPVATIAEAIVQTCDENGLSTSAIGIIASVDLKKEEQGLLAYAGTHDIPLIFYNSTQLNTMKVQASSDKVMQVTGAKAVAEPAALLAAQTDHLLVPKTKFPAVTVAIAKIRHPFAASKKRAE